MQLQGSFSVGAHGVCSLYIWCAGVLGTKYPPPGGLLGIKCPPVREQIVGHKGGGYKEIRLELFVGSSRIEDS